MNIEWIAYSDIEQVAEQLLQTHGLDGCIPVDVEAMERKMRLDIIPVPGLRGDRIDTDGCVGGIDVIYVDEKLLNGGNAERYRFTLAHEIGHIVLHADFLNSFVPESVEEWIAALGCLTEQDRKRLERQAHRFAAALLMPAQLVSRRFDEYVPEMLELVDQAYKAGVTNTDAIADGAQDYMVRKLAEDFEVNDSPMEYRLNETGLDDQVRKLCNR